MDLSTFVRDIPDFPKKGIIFKDITPLLNNPEALSTCLSRLVSNTPSQVDKVIGIEARGFFFGTALAEKLQAGFIPVRKKGKLPYDTISEQYSLEYGEDALEIHKDAIRKGDKVLIHDDVLATGGTAKAVINLVEKLGGEVVQCNFLIELDFLKGRNKLNTPIFSLLNY